MAFGQFNTGFQVGTKPSFGTGISSSFSTGFSPSISTNTTTQNKKKSDNYTYNPRYPGFDEEDYKKLEQMVVAKGFTGDKKTDVMDQLYKIYSPQVLNKHKLDERQQEINNSVYQNGEALLDGNKEATMGTNLTTLAQEVKKKYNIPYNVPDDQIIEDIRTGLENGSNLLYEYTQNGNPEIFYAAGIWDRPQQQSLVENQGVRQGGVKSLVNPADNTVLPSAWELVNPVGYAAETVDNAANKFADKFTVTGEGAVNSLKSKIENMSKEEIEAYRKEFRKAVGEKRIGTAYTKGDTIVERLWNGIKGDFYYPEDDEAFMKWLIDQKTDFGEYMMGANDVLKGENNPNVIKFFSNIPSSTVKTFTATVRGMTNPYDTMKGLYKLAATEEGHQALLNRYGSWDALANAMNTDPVGVADDFNAVASILRGGVKGAASTYGKVTGNANLVNSVSNLPKFGSVMDAGTEKLLYGGPITYSKSPLDDRKNTKAGLINGGFKDGYTPNLKTVETKGLYGVMDSLAGDNKILNGINRYAQDTSSVSKLTDNMKKDVTAIKGKANQWADEIIQNNNRMTKKQQENFKKMSGEDQGKWMNDRNIRTQEELVDYFLESKNKVDDAMGKIEGQFTSKELTTVLDDSIDFAKKTENKDLSRLQELQTKNANGGLTMSEINEVKRFYEKNNKFNYLKEGTAEKSALATNRDTALREWQQKIATENGLDNLKDLNKETQAAKFLADNATNWQSGIKGNNPISLTDWIVFAGDGISANSLGGLVSKKIFTSPRFQNKLVDVLNYIGGHKTKGEINPNYQAIDMKNDMKNYEKRILAEELAKVKNEKQFNEWLKKAEYMAGPALPEKIDQGGVVAGDRPFITQNGPTADELGLGKIVESTRTPDIQTRFNNELANMKNGERLLVKELFEGEEVSDIITKTSNGFKITDDAGTEFFIKNEELGPNGLLTQNAQLIGFENIGKVK